jgi:ABC-type bacteriocin/lantibiotic exporter with double-glycine peptidase domain
VKDLVVGTGMLFYAVIVALVVVVLVGVLWYAVAPYFKDAEREIIQHSNQYVQSKVTELVESYEAYQRLETQKRLYTDPALVKSFEGQQRATVQRMCNAYRLIPEDVNDVPAYIVRFMEEQNCG